MNISTVAFRTVLSRVAHPASLALAAALTATILIACAATGYLTRPSSLPGTATPQVILDHWRARAGVPATVMAVQRSDGTRWVGASGTLLRHGDTPATPTARFRIASITKLFVATVVLQLAQDHQLAITDPLDRYVPGFPGADRITIGQLLDHTSGIPDYGQIEGFSDHLLTDRQHRYTTQQVLSLIAHRKRDFAPGADYAYSNSNYLLLADVITAVTHDTWSAQIRRRIINPLNLTDTYIAGAEPATGAVIPGYFDADNDGTEENIETGQPWPALETSEGPAGAIVSTAGDLATFGDALYHGRLLTPATLRTMTAPHPFHPRTSNYGYGTEISHLGYDTTVLGHGGFLPGFKSILWYVPSRDLTITVLTNDSTANPADLAELILRQQPQQATAPA
jgi:D-alanyl-D-alanine carboxypeptidase